VPLFNCFFPETLDPSVDFTAFERRKKVSKRAAPSFIKINMEKRE